MKKDTVDPETLDGAETCDTDDPAPRDEHDDLVKARKPVKRAKKAKRIA